MKISFAADGSAYSECAARHVMPRCLAPAAPDVIHLASLPVTVVKQD